MLFDANLDPNVRSSISNNENLELSNDFLLAAIEPTSIKKKKRRCKLGKKRWAKIAETANTSDKLLADSGGGLRMTLPMLLPILFLWYLTMKHRPEAGEIESDSGENK